MKYLYKNYCISDIANGVFPETPKLKAISDYKLIINRIPDIRNIFDFLQIFNSTGIIAAVEKWYSYTDGVNEYEFAIQYSMFGTYISQVNSDNYPSGSDTGAFAKGSTPSWGTEIHIHGMDNIWHNYKDYVKDIHDFYDMRFDIPTEGDIEYYSTKEGRPVCSNFGNNIVDLGN